MDDFSEGAVGLWRKNSAKLNADDLPDTEMWYLRWKYVLIFTDSVLGIFPEAVLGLAGVSCAAAGAIYLSQKWGWALNANQGSSVASATDQIASATGVSNDHKKSDMNWIVMYLMYAVGVVVGLAFMYSVFLLPDEERPERLVKKLKGGMQSSVPTYALLIVGASIAGVLSSIIAESTLRYSDPGDFHKKEIEIPSTNRRLLFLHGIVGIAVAYAILLVIYPAAWVGQYKDTKAFS